jgi:hypothetical protein
MDHLRIREFIFGLLRRDIACAIVVEIQAYARRSRAPHPARPAWSWRDGTSADRMAPLPDRANPIGYLAIGDNRPGGRELVFIERDAGIEELAQQKHR